jgi:ATP-binding cassette subfamily C protein CydCD
MRPDLALVRRIPALRRHLVVCAAAALATAAVVLVQAEVLADGLARLAGGDAGAVGGLVVALVLVGAVRAAARWAVDRSATRAMGDARRQVTADVLDRLDRLDETGRAQLAPATAASLPTTGVDAMEPWVRSFLPALCLAAVVPLAAGLRILAADVVAAAILAVAIPLIPLFMALIGRMTQERSEREWATLQRLGAHFHDVLVGIETLRLFGRAEAQVARVREVTDRYRVAVLRTLRVAFLSALALELLSTLSVALVAVATGARLAAGDLGLRTALVVLLLAPECTLPLRRVGAAFHASVAGSDALAELGRLDGLATRPDGDRRGRVEGTVRARRLVVDDAARGRRLGPVDLDVAPGEVVAVCGPTGCGKSTLLAAVAGDVPVASGSLEVGGAAVGEWSDDARRAALVAVPQHPAPLGPTVLASVRLGAPAASRRDALAALHRLGLAELADRRPGDLSGGERQRLAVARALLAVDRRGATVVLADEPTAHLDRARAEQVVEVLHDLAAAGAAVVVVTHDAAVADAAARVVRVAAVPAPATTPVGGSGGVDAGRRVAEVDERPPAEELAVPTSGGGRWADLRWAHQLAAGARSRVALARSLGVAAELCAVGLAGTAAWLIMRAGQHPSFADLALVAVAVRAFGVGKGAFRYAERLASHDAALRRLAAVRAAVVAHLARLVPAGVPRDGRGALLAVAVDDVDRLADVELRAAGPAVAAGAVAAGAVVAVGVVAGPVAAGVLAACVLAGGVLLPARVAWVAAAVGDEATAARAATAGGVLDLAEHAGQVAALGATDAWRDRVAASVSRSECAERRRGASAATAAGALAGLGPWTAAATVAVLGAAGGTIGAPALGVAVLLPLAVAELLAPSIEGAERAAGGAAAARRLRQLLTRPDPTPEPVSPAAPGAGADLDLVGVRAGWPEGPDVLGGLDLRLGEADRLVVRGPSGSGKSTLAATLVGFLSLRAGSYRVGGVEAGALGGRQVRRTVTWCTQDPWMGATSLRENLRLAAPSATDDDLRPALAVVGLGGWVAGLPEGLDTLLGPGGTGTSGGQRRRLALARVLLSDHRALVLDEPTAHLDVDTATAVLADVLAALADRSVVLISHTDPTPAGAAELDLDRTPGVSIAAGPG